MPVSAHLRGEGKIPHENKEPPKQTPTPTVLIQHECRTIQGSLRRMCLLQIQTQIYVYFQAMQGGDGKTGMQKEIIVLTLLKETSLMIISTKEN